MRSPRTHPLLCHPCFTHDALALFRATITDPRARSNYTILSTCIASLYAAAPQLDTLQPQLLDCTHILRLAASIVARLPLGGVAASPPPSIPAAAPPLSIPADAVPPSIPPPPTSLTVTPLTDVEQWRLASIHILRLSAAPTAAEGAHLRCVLLCQIAFFRVWRRVWPRERVLQYGAAHAFGAPAAPFLEAATPAAVWDAVEHLLEAAQWARTLHPWAHVRLVAARAKGIVTAATAEEKAALLRAELEAT